MPGEKSCDIQSARVIEKKQGINKERKKQNKTKETVEEARIQLDFVDKVFHGISFICYTESFNKFLIFQKGFFFFNMLAFLMDPNKAKIFVEFYEGGNHLSKNKLKSRPNKSANDTGTPPG